MTRGLPQVCVSQTVPTRFSMISLDTRAPPFICFDYPQLGMRRADVKQNHVVRALRVPTMMRNGTSAIKEMASLTNQSATARLTQSGASGPTKRKGAGPPRPIDRRICVRTEKRHRSGKRDAEKQRRIQRRACEGRHQRRAPPSATTEPVKHRNISQLRRQKRNPRRHRDAQRHCGIFIPVPLQHDLRADQRASHPGDKPRHHHAARRPPVHRRDSSHPSPKRPADR